MPEIEDIKIIVIDPGHGGNNLGLTYGGYTESGMTPVTAQAMKEELEKYDNVKVYITNENGADMSLAQRAEFAKSVEADVLISLHFNMSENHTLYGSEIWVPAEGTEYARMRSLGDVLLGEFQTAGLTSRGVKTKCNEEGSDYYGIIREAQNLGIPAMIVEHCHADQARDSGYLDSAEKLMEFGKMDATAVAKYYGLSSETLGTDYAEYIQNGYFAPEAPIGEDKTGPEEVTLKQITEGNQTDKAELTFLLSAREEESELTYYDYSIDGGAHFTELLPFGTSEHAVEFSVPEVAEGSTLVARVYNGYTVAGEESNRLMVHAVKEDTNDTETEAVEEAKSELQKQTDTSTQKTVAGTAAVGVIIALICLICAINIRKRKVATVILGMAGLILLTATGWNLVAQKENPGAEKTDGKHQEEQQEEQQKEQQEETVSGNGATLKLYTEETISREEADQILQEETASTVVYDIAEGYMKVNFLEEVPGNTYDFSKLTTKNGYPYYEDDMVSTKLGIDASKFQNDIDWQKVKDAGVEFAIIRLGFRGYESGELVLDEKFAANIEGARAAGIAVGVYFFSSAITEEEAVQEADFVLKAIAPYQIDMPVVFDTEPVLANGARNESITPDQTTAFASAFLGRVKESGYRAMIYANAKRLTTVLHLEELKEYPLWYADYQEKPIYPYAYEMWQYTEKGSIPGVEGNVDLNLWFVKK